MRQIGFQSSECRFSAGRYFGEVTRRTLDCYCYTAIPWMNCPTCWCSLASKALSKGANIENCN